jgi:ribosomal protein S18 acetylase RimI-like enzyme
MTLSSAPYALRAIDSGDAEFLFRVYASTREEELAAAPWTAEQKTAFLRMQFAAQTAHYRSPAYDGASFDVLLVDGAPAGRLYVLRMAREILVMEITLLPSFRRRGIGERVFRDVFAEADRDRKTVSINVEAYNPARRLYDRLGFHVVNERPLEEQVYVRMERDPVTELAS